MSDGQCTVITLLPTTVSGADAPQPYDDGEWYADSHGYWMVRGSAVPDYVCNKQSQPWIFKLDVIQTLKHGKTIEMKWWGVLRIDYYGYAVFKRHDNGAFVCIPRRHWAMMGGPEQAWFTAADVYPDIVHDGLSADGLPNTWMVGALNLRQNVAEHIAHLFDPHEDDWRSKTEPLQHGVMVGVPSATHIVRAPMWETHKADLLPMFKKMIQQDAEVYEILRKQKNILASEGGEE